jgi:hypothetical protein
MKAKQNQQQQQLNEVSISKQPYFGAPPPPPPPKADLKKSAATTAAWVTLGATEVGFGFRDWGRKEPGGEEVVGRNFLFFLTAVESADVSLVEGLVVPAGAVPPLPCCCSDGSYFLGRPLERCRLFMNSASSTIQKEPKSSS